MLAISILKTPERLD